MGRQKGSKKTGGRARGTPNRTTSDLKTWVNSILDNGREKFEESLQYLEPAEYIRVFTGLLNYTLPKQASTTPEETLRREKEMLQELLLSLPEEAINRIAKRLYEKQNKEENKRKSKQ